MSLNAPEWDLPVPTTDRPLATSAVFISREQLLWAGIALIAVASRLVYLDFAPLNNVEAATSLRALALLQDGNTFVNTAITANPSAGISAINPLFTALQAFLFAIFGPTDLTARLVPALAGIVFVLLPWTQRATMGASKALWMGLFLALSPTLWFVSRQADGASLAWMLAVATYSAWRLSAQPRYQVSGPIISGVCCGLLLACGQQAISPLLVVGAARLVSPAVPIDWRKFGPAAAISLVLGSTALLFRIAGLGDVFNGIAGWWQQLTQPGPFVIGRLLMGLAIYEPLLYLSAIAGVVWLIVHRQPWRGEWVNLARMGVGLILLVLLQGRQPDILVPVIMGLAGFAAGGADAIARNIREHAVPRYEGSLTCISFVLFLLGGVAFRQYASSGDTTWLLLITVAVLFNLALLAFGNLLQGFGVGLRAIAMAAGLMLVLHTTSAAIQLNHVRPTNPAEPYVIAPAALETRTLAQTVQTISIRAYGESSAIKLDGAADTPASVRWTLRDQSGSTLRGASEDSAAALTPIGQRPGSAESNIAFVGSSFVVQRSLNLNAVRCTPAGDRTDCSAIARWIAFREAGTPSLTQCIFWLRGDVAALASGSR